MLNPEMKRMPEVIEEMSRKSNIEKEPGEGKKEEKLEVNDHENPDGELEEDEKNELMDEINSLYHLDRESEVSVYDFNVNS